MKSSMILMITYLLVTYITAQVTNYDDVAVIVNDNSTQSIEIGDYFKEKRNIPDINMIHINCSTEERIDSTELFSIVQQVSNYLVNNNISGTINYLVTTKGVPLIFEGGNCDSIPGFLDCSSIDSELTLVVNHEDEIGKSSHYHSPYYDEFDYDFSQMNYDIFLVTRLDGYTVDHVIGLINRSGPDLKVDKSTAQFIFDLAFAQDTFAIAIYNEVLNLGNELVQSRGWNSIYDPDPSTFITDESNVLGYYSYLFEPSNKTLNYEWLNGSIAVQCIGSTAFTFLEEENIYNDLILANIIEEGVCGAAGTTTYYFFSNGTFWPEILFDRYIYGLDTISEINPYFNLAESYYQSLMVLSSVHVIVGDPKTSIVLGEPDGIIEISPFAQLRVFPNPAQNLLSVNYTIKETTSIFIGIFDIYGTTVYQYNGYEQYGQQNHLIDITKLPKGVYFYRISTKEGIAKSGRIIKN